MRVAVLFSGGPAPAGHSVVYWLSKHLPKEAILFGVRRGALGLINNDLFELSSSVVEAYKDRGGFDLLKTSRRKIKSEEDFQAILSTIDKEKLNTIIFIGGDDTATNAYHLSKRTKCQILHIPKTIDGDLPVKSFGFDTATHLFSTLIHNLKVDARSTEKYYHVVKLMGRDSSHLTLETALRSKPNLALITEELIEKKISLEEVIDDILSLFKERDKDYGTIIIPEGIVLAFPELMEEGELDSHGNPPISSMDSHVKLFEKVKKRGEKLPSLRFCHYGYEARCQDPTDEDLAYSKVLGTKAALLLGSSITSVMVTKNEPIPLASLMIHDEKRGEVVEKVLVDIEGEMFQQFAKERSSWRTND